MNTAYFPYSIFSLGDAAITIELGNTIDETINQQVINLFHQLIEDPFPGMIDVVPAYSAVTVHYDIVKIRKNNPDNTSAFETIRQWIDKRMQQPVQQTLMEQRLVRVPVCYEQDFAPDLQQFISAKQISKEELIELHTTKIYKVFMIGFLPGFAYMGEVDDKIAMPRKQQPNIVAAGSVGIAGKQTGIYPLISPGGWHIIGRTPLKIFDPGKKDAILLKTGDSIQFYSISKTEYAHY